MQRLTRKLALIVTLALLASLVLALTVGRPERPARDDGAGASAAHGVVGAVHGTLAMPKLERGPTIPKAVKNPY